MPLMKRKEQLAESMERNGKEAVTTVNGQVETQIWSFIPSDES